ncbi:unnamed protein product [Didymodactylos carnosus]|uniref:Uncharacterized protein n=1 Tax=Didymodactylos carnosus TaxID=1234261 RepID=A0A8S2GKU7_9BILA|nr:unnamed protein product [Didymodactylos carnosus]CAF3532523.1 unnamed protein product [Didymodactylos carnosus]
MADIITKRGIGNGASLIIAAGIIANLPYDLSTAFVEINGMVAFISGSTRKIPIQKVSQGVISTDQLPYLPIKGALFPELDPGLKRPDTLVGCWDELTELVDLTLP